MKEEFDETFLDYSDELICPYCHTVQIMDDYSLPFEEDGQSYTCEECNKEFMFATSSKITIENIRKVPCLNGEPHKFVKSPCSVCKGLILLTCEYCGEDKFVKKEAYIPED